MLGPEETPCTGSRPLRRPSAPPRPIVAPSRPSERPYGAFFALPADSAATRFRRVLWAEVGVCLTLCAQNLHLRRGCPGVGYRPVATVVATVWVSAEKSERESTHVNALDRLRAAAKHTAKSVVRLPIVSRQVAEDPRLERTLAQQELVPRRCGLCRFFDRSAFERTLTMQRAMAQAMQHLSPALMGAARGEERPPQFSEAALDLRPTLRDRWEDYGTCTRWDVAINGFIEEPPMPGPNDAPCTAWT